MAIDNTNTAKSIWEELDELEKDHVRQVSEENDLAKKNALYVDKYLNRIKARKHVEKKEKARIEQEYQQRQGSEDDDIWSKVNNSLDNNKALFRKYVESEGDKVLIDKYVQQGLAGEPIDLVEQFDQEEANKQAYIQYRKSQSRINPKDYEGASSLWLGKSHPSIHEVYYANDKALGYDPSWRDPLRYHYVDDDAHWDQVPMFHPNDPSNFPGGETLTPTRGFFDPDGLLSFGSKTIDDRVPIDRKDEHGAAEKDLGQHLVMMNFDSHRPEEHRRANYPSVQKWKQYMQHWYEHGVPSVQMQSEALDEVYGLEYEERKAEDSLTRAYKDFESAFSFGMRSQATRLMPGRSGFEKFTKGGIQVVGGLGEFALSMYGGAKLLGAGTKAVKAAGASKALVSANQMGAGVNNVSRLQKFAAFIDGTSKTGRLTKSLITNTLGFNIHGQAFYKPDRDFGDRLKEIPEATFHAALFSAAGNLGKMAEGMRLYKYAKAAEYPAMFALGYSLTPEDPNNPQNSFDKIVGGLTLMGLHGAFHGLANRGAKKQIREDIKGAQRLFEQKLWGGKQNVDFVKNIETIMNKLKKEPYEWATIAQRYRKNYNALRNMTDEQWAQYAYQRGAKWTDVYPNKPQPRESSGQLSRGVVDQTMYGDGKGKPRVPLENQIDAQRAAMAKLEYPELQNIAKRVKSSESDPSLKPTSETRLQIDELRGNLAEGLIFDKEGNMRNISADEALFIDTMLSAYEQRLDLVDRGGVKSEPPIEPIKKPEAQVPSDVIPSPQGKSQTESINLPTGSKPANLPDQNAVQAQKISLAKPEAKNEIVFNEDSNLDLGEGPISPRTGKVLKQFSKPIDSLQSGIDRAKKIDKWIDNAYDKMEGAPERRQDELQDQIYEAEEYRDNLYMQLDEKGITENMLTGGERFPWEKTASETPKILKTKPKESPPVIDPQSLKTPKIESLLIDKYGKDFGDSRNFKADLKEKYGVESIEDLNSGQKLLLETDLEVEAISKGFEVGFMGITPNNMRILKEGIIDAGKFAYNNLNRAARRLGEKIGINEGNFRERFNQWAKDPKKVPFKTRSFFKKVWDTMKGWWKGAKKGWQATKSAFKEVGKDVKAEIKEIKRTGKAPGYIQPGAFFKSGKPKKGGVSPVMHKGEPQGVVVLGADMVGRTKGGKRAPEGIRYVEHHKGFAVSKGMATKIKKQADAGNNVVAIMGYPNLLSSMKVNPVFQEALNNALGKAIGKRTLNRITKETDGNLQKTTQIINQELKAQGKPIVNMTEVSKWVGEPDASQLARRIIYVGKLKEIREGDFRTTKHDTYPVEPLFEQVVELENKPRIDELIEGLPDTSFKAGRKYWGMDVQQDGLVALKGESPLADKLIEMASGGKNLFKPEKGAPIQFASPATDPTMTPEKAVLEVGSEKSREYARAGSDIDAEMGLKSNVRESVGLTEQYGNENSLISTYQKNVPKNKLNEKGAYMGLLGNQIDIVNFHPKDKGPHKLHKVTLPESDALAVQYALNKLGVDNMSITPRGLESDVYIWNYGDFDTKILNKIGEQYGKKYETQEGIFENLTNESTRRGAVRKYTEIVGRELAKSGKISKVFKDRLSIFRSPKVAERILQDIENEAFKHIKIDKDKPYKDLNPLEKKGVNKGKVAYFRTGKEINSGIEVGFLGMTPNNFRLLGRAMVDTGRFAYNLLPRYIRRQGKKAGINESNFREAFNDAANPKKAGFMKRVWTQMKNLWKDLKDTFNYLAEKGIDIPLWMPLTAGGPGNFIKVKLRFKRRAKAEGEFKDARRTSDRRGSKMDPSELQMYVTKRNKIAHMIEDDIIARGIRTKKQIAKEKKAILGTNSLGDLMKKDKSGNLLDNEADLKINTYIRSLRRHENMARTVSYRKVTMQKDQIPDFKENVMDMNRKANNDNPYLRTVQDHRDYELQDKDLIADANTNTQINVVKNTKAGNKLSEIANNFRNVSGWADIVQQKTGIPLFDIVEEIRHNFVAMENANTLQTNKILNIVKDNFYEDVFLGLGKRKMFNWQHIDPTRRQVIHAAGQGDEGALADLRPEEKLVLKAIKEYLNDPAITLQYKMIRFNDWANGGKKPAGVKKEQLESLQNTLNNEGFEAFKSELEVAEGFTMPGDTYMPNLSHLNNLEGLTGVPVGPTLSPSKGFIKSRKKDMAGQEGDALDNIFRKIKAHNKLYYLDSSVKKLRDILETDSVPTHIRHEIENYIMELYKPDPGGFINKLANSMGGQMLKTVLMLPPKLVRNLAQPLTYPIAYLGPKAGAKFIGSWIKASIGKGGLIITRGKQWKKLPEDVQDYFLTNVSQDRAWSQDLTNTAHLGLLDRMGTVGQYMQRMMDWYKWTDTKNRFTVFEPMYYQCMAALEHAHKTGLSFNQKAKGFPMGKTLKESLLWDTTGHFRSLQDLLRPEIDKALMGDKEAMKFVAMRIARHLSSDSINWDYHRTQRIMLEKNNPTMKLGARIGTYPISQITAYGKDVGVMHRGFWNKDKKQFMKGFKAVFGRVLSYLIIEDIVLNGLFGHRDEENKYGWGYGLTNALGFRPFSFVAGQAEWLIQGLKTGWNVATGSEGAGKDLAQFLERSAQNYLPFYGLIPPVLEVAESKDKVKPIMDIYESISGEENTYRQKEWDWETWDWIRHGIFDAGYPKAESDDDIQQRYKERTGFHGI